MSTDLRALCAELTDFLAELPFATCEELVVRARAALASPGSGLPQRPENFEFALDFLGGPENDELLAYVEQLEARAALMADGPAVPKGREPASVASEPSDEELDACADELLDWNLEGHRAFARAVLARYGHQPAPPAAGEVGELVAWLRAWALGTMEEGQPATSRSLTRTADLLAQRHPAPVPVSERLPELRGMFHRILCVARSSGQRPVGNIELADRLIKAVVSWSALPLPAGEVSDDR